MESDEQLLERWRVGDKRAGNELFQRHYVRVRRFIANKVSDEIEDLVQRTFETLATQPERYAGKSSFVSFLLGIANNIVRAHWRRKAPTRDVDFDEVSIASLGAGPSTLLTRVAEERLLLEALRRLPLGSQIVLETFYWEHLTGPELAELFEVSEPAIRNRIRRAKEQLARELETLAKGGIVLDSTMTNLDRWAEQVRTHLDERSPPDEPA